MQQLSEVISRDVARCAGRVVDVGLAVTRLVRAEMRRRTPGGLTLPQLRALAFVNADPECAPSELAEYLMLSRPAVSRLLDGLVARGLLSRRPHPDDRRRLRLAITSAGRARLETYFARARAIVAARLAPLPPRERRALTRALAILSPLVAGRAAD